MPSRILLTFAFLLTSILPMAAQSGHPHVWVTEADKADIIEKINNEEWAGILFTRMRTRIEEVVEAHQADRDAFIKGLPLDWSGGTGTHPSFSYMYDGAEDDRWPLMNYLQDAIECGIVYYVTGEEKYAQAAADIMATVVSAMARVERIGGAANGGLLYPNNHLKEARVFGAQVPIGCDFIYSYVKAGAQVYDVVTGNERDFPFEDAQKVFKTYADMAIESGHTGSNWSVLESPSLVQNTLMLDSQAEIDAYLPYYLNVGTSRQDPLSVVAKSFAQPGDIWPESFQYSLYVTEITLNLMALLDRRDPDLNLAQSYPNIVTSAGRTHNLRFPNEDLPALGDGGRYYPPLYLAMEVAYYLSFMANDTENMERYGSLIKSGIADEKYSRSTLPGRSLSPEPYFTPLKLLWSVPDLIGNEQDYPRTRTAELPFAGLFLQRNLSTSANPERDSMMAVVSGASYVHSHATGMGMELYGVGDVIGTSGGVGSYTTDIHENYYRLFAASNTVISNGASATSGPWVNLGMDTVKMESMEPLPHEEAISPNISFSTTSFQDKFNLVAPAEHQRTVALIRTSPTSGYFVDIFRARSNTPNQFHDYLYRNAADSLEFMETPPDFVMTPTPERFQASADLPWSQNSRYRHPGWHFFEEVSTASTVSEPIVGRFNMDKLLPRTVLEIIQGIKKSATMEVHMNGASNRSYSKALAPISKNAPGNYTPDKLPTLVVRQEGEAWSNPFAFVYEPYVDTERDASVQSVDTLTQSGVFKGLAIQSIVDGEQIHQYVLNPDNSILPYTNPELDITFRGHFAVVTTDGGGELISLYIGDGESLQYKDTVLTSDPVTKAAYYDPSVKLWYDSSAMGWLEYSNYPYVYSDSLGGWLYHPYDSVDQSDSSWYYIFKP
jgi:hypothetical protein